MTRRFGLAITLIAGFVIFYLGSVTPKPAPADAPASAFSAARAFADVQAMGSVPHALGSPADAHVRDVLMARMQALGLSPQVQRGTAFEVHGPLISGGMVENVIGVLPGRDRAAPALVLMAHHDSVPGSPGAADDTAGVASILEVVRALKTHGVPARDVMVAITDGEEAGLLGARAFFDSPLAAHVGYVMNLETRGGGGRAIMFETAEQNGADIALYHRTAVTPESNALTVFIYQHLPNDTDFTVAKQHGKVGLNYAFIGRQFDYHSPSSTPKALDIGALQHMGQQVLPTAVALAFGPLPARTPDVVYGNLLFGLTLAYPPWVGWLILAASGVAIMVGVARARRLEPLPAVEIVRGVGAGLYLIALSGTALELARRATGVASGWTEFRPLLARFATFEVMMLLAALAVLLVTATLIRRPKSRLLAAALPLVFGAAACLFGGADTLALGMGAVGALIGLLTFGRSAGTAAAWTGLLGLMLAAAAVLQALAPTAAYVIAWPLAAACLSFVLSRANAAPGGRDRLVQALIAVLTLAWIGYLFHALLQGLDLPALAILPTMLAALALWPLAIPEDTDQASVRSSVLLFISAGVIAAFLHLTSPWTPRHPNAVEPIFVIDPAGQKAWRASQQPLDAWSRGVLTAEGGTITRRTFGFSRDPVDAAPAAYQAAPEPAVTARAGPGGLVTIVATPHAGSARFIIVLNSPEGLDTVTADGQPAIERSRVRAPRPYAVARNALGAVIWSSPQSLTLTLHTADPQHLKIAVTEAYDHWMSARPLPPTPPKDQLWNEAGSTYVVGQARVQP